MSFKMQSPNDSKIIEHAINLYQKYATWGNGRRWVSESVIAGGWATLVECSNELWTLNVSCSAVSVLQPVNPRLL